MTTGGDYLDGHGASVAWTVGANASLVATIISIDLPAESGEEIDTSHLGSGTHRTKTIGGLRAHGDVTMNIVFDMATNHTPVIGGAVDTVTLTMPQRTGETVAGKVVFSAFVKEWSPGSVSSNARVEGSITLAVTGDVAYTAGS